MDSDARLGEVIDESLDIMLWALGRNDPERWMTPDTDSLQGMLALIARFDSHFKQHLDRYKYPDRHAGADALSSRTEACLDLQLLDDRLVGAAYLVVICLIPQILSAQAGLNIQLGGTSLLIVVNVTMDTVSQIQSHLIAHQYGDLIKKAKLKGGRLR